MEKYKSRCIPGMKSATKEVSTEKMRSTMGSIDWNKEQLKQWLLSWVTVTLVYEGRNCSESTILNMEHLLTNLVPKLYKKCSRIQPRSFCAIFDHQQPNALYHSSQSIFSIAHCSSRWISWWATFCLWTTFFSSIFHPNDKPYSVNFHEALFAQPIPSKTRLHFSYI